MDLLERIEQEPIHIPPPTCEDVKAACHEIVTYALHLLNREGIESDSVQRIIDGLDAAADRAFKRIKTQATVPLRMSLDASTQRINDLVAYAENEKGR